MSGTETRSRGSYAAAGAAPREGVSPRGPHNPFATRHVRPGALPFLFGPPREPGAGATDADTKDEERVAGSVARSVTDSVTDRATDSVDDSVTGNVADGAPDSAATCVARLRAGGWWGQITGRHGSGKSTLLETLRPALRGAGRDPLPVTLRDGQRRLPPQLAAADWSPETQVIVDGYEQLGRLARWRLHRRCRRAGCGLLVTAHRDVRLPPVAHLVPREEIVWQIVDRLLADAPLTIERSEVAARLAAREGDVRETLFDLYDLYERRRRHD